MSKFKSTMRKGFHMTFANGLTASVQWGAMNYCDNKELDFDLTSDAQSDTAEVAVFDDNGFVNLSEFLHINDSVCGWLTPDQVVDFLYAVKNAK